ncbi:hypothetical protein OAV88_04315 [bacterium]|nr:hypothetical protein [bacterium]
MSDSQNDEKKISLCTTTKNTSDITQENVLTTHNNTCSIIYIQHKRTTTPQKVKTFNETCSSYSIIHATKKCPLFFLVSGVSVWKIFWNFFLKLREEEEEEGNARFTK